MKKAEIEVGGVYLARVNNRLVQVRVEAIRKTSLGTRYDVRNLLTERCTTFRSAQKFRGPADIARNHEAAVQASGPRSPLTRAGVGYFGEEPDPLQPGSRFCPKCGGALTLRAAGGDGPVCDCESEEGEHRPDPTQKTSTAVLNAGIESGTATVPASEFGLGQYLSSLRSADGDAPHLIIEARAGTGKTTTLVEGLKVLRGLEPRIQPSPQQRAIWDALCLSRGKAQSVCFVAFNKSIATELQARVPPGCDAMTMHSMGFKAVQKALGRQEPNSYVVQDIIAELLGMDLRELRRRKPVLLKATEDLVSLCKMNLVDGRFGVAGMLTPEGQAEEWAMELDRLVSHYDVDLNGSRREVFDLVPRVMDRCREPRGKITFDDMIWLPVVLNLPVFRYDLLLVDEYQDTNRCQQALAKRAGKRLILCGDPKQAIYGFAGADAESMGRMAQELMEARRSSGSWTNEFRPGVITLPLTVTRRCGKAIVAEANKIVPDFEAHESNPAGKVYSAVYPERSTSGQLSSGIPQPRELQPEEKANLYSAICTDGDMVLCRVNAPLVSECFRFLREGRKAIIQGRDIGAGLVASVKKRWGVSRDGSGPDAASFVANLDDWLSEEQRKENAKKSPNENRLIALQDRHDCLVCFTADLTARDTGDAGRDKLIRRIEAIFTDDKSSPGIRLSSIHRAKGLEARRVFLLEPKGATVPHPMARRAWQVEQEWNLRYVAITRAIEELVYVS